MKKRVTVKQRPVVGADDIYTSSYNATTDALNALETFAQNPGQAMQQAAAAAQQAANAGTQIAQQTPIAPPGQGQFNPQNAASAAAAVAAPLTAAAQKAAQPVIDQAAQKAGESYGKSFWANFPVWGKLAVGVGLVAAVASVAMGAKKR